MSPCCKIKSLAMTSSAPSLIKPLSSSPSHFFRSATAWFNLYIYYLLQDYFVFTTLSPWIQGQEAGGNFVVCNGLLCIERYLWCWIYLDSRQVDPALQVCSSGFKGLLLGSPDTMQMLCTDAASRRRDAEFDATAFILCLPQWGMSSDPCFRLICLHWFLRAAC